MTGKIFRSILTASAATLLAALVIVFGVLYSYFTLALNTQMKAQLHFAAQGVACAGESYLEGLAEQNYRLTLIDTDGRVLYDSRADAATLENHGNRPEVQSAFQSGTGESTRFSSALLEQTAYFAERLPDGRVLRISTARDSVLTLVLGFMQPIILTFMLAVILSAVLARRMSRRIVEPLNTLNLDEPLDNEAYDEISPLLLHIEQQNRKINSQIRELQRNQTEFAAVTENMKEGLV
ncbi:MAG: two-component sensor histidine kinase, partial [Clostridia bacterium]